MGTKKLAVDISEQAKEKLRELAYIDRSNMTKTIEKLIEQAYTKIKK